MPAPSRRFLLSDAADVDALQASPNAQIDWDDVGCVYVQASEPVICPITLDPPRVPVITPCGHIFELPAIIQVR